MWINKQTNKKTKCWFGPTAEVKSEVIPEVKLAETSLIKWSEVFLIGNCLVSEVRAGAVSHITNENLQTYADYVTIGINHDCKFNIM